jgi:predicted RNA-binding protein Jag
MKKELIVTAKTVEDAKAKAAAELGIAVEELEITVLEEGKRGFLGIGASDAKISVSYTMGGAEVAEAFIRQIVADVELDLTVGTRPGTNDDTVDPEWSKKIVAASSNDKSKTYFIEGMDHTFNVFAEEDLHSLYDAVDATGAFFADTLG